MLLVPVNLEEISLCNGYDKFSFDVSLNLYIQVNVGPICSNKTEGMKHTCSFVLTGDNRNYHNIALS